MRLAGGVLPPLAGIPFSVKDNIAVAGMKTRAGSRVLAAAPAETFDALVVRDLRALGAICVGKTNMTEFAYSALGNNAHFGTPLSNRETGQIAGGSSSGAAVSVAEGMVSFAVGTDTSGSCRIPAAFCGIAGFRPTAGRYPRDNTIPLAPTFDSVGTLAASCADLAFLDGLLAPPGHPIPKAHGTGLLVPDEAVDDIDPDVAHAFEGVVAQLREAGTPIRRASIPVIAETRALAGSAQIVGFEAYSWHRDLFAAHADRYDPRVAIRLAADGSLSASTYAYGLRRLADLRKEFDRAVGDAAGMLLPTVPIPAPHLDELVEEEAYLRLNAKVFSLTATASHFDRPSVSLRGPCPIMFIGRRGDDRNLLELGSTLEHQIEVPQ